jgi:hypothetical protein
MKGANMERAKEALDQDNSSESELVNGRRKAASSESEPGMIRLKLSAKLSAEVRAAISDLKTRGVTVTPEELLEEYLDGVREQYFAGQILTRTPEEFYIREALQVPELREKFAKQAMKALLHGSGTGKSGSARKARPRKEAAREGLGSDSAYSNPEVMNDGTH